jgi:carbohydrate kinase (thermoresistant glucokinase family)
MIVVVMGVTGSGKSTIGRLLAARLGLAFIDGDDFHTSAAMAAMSAGHPLTEADRIPWLDRLHDELGRRGAAGVVLACSALTPDARERLSGDLPDVRYVWLHGDPALLADRITHRVGHPVGVSLLPSQLDTLVPPADALSVDVAPPPSAIIEEIVSWLAPTRPDGGPR